jgi:hypothetical protein
VGLGRLDPRKVCRWPKRLDTSQLQGIYHPGLKRYFRSYDRDVDALTYSEVDNSLDIARGNPKPFSGCAAISRSDQKAADPW